MEYVLKKEEYDELITYKNQYQVFYQEVREIIRKDSITRKYYTQDSKYLPDDRTIYLFDKKEKALKDIYNSLYLHSNDLIFGTAFNNKKDERKK